jgi:hypothetical protein
MMNKRSDKWRVDDECAEDMKEKRGFVSITPVRKKKAVAAR